MKLSSIRGYLLAAGLVGLLFPGVSRSQTQSSNSNSGESQRFTVSLTNTHGVSTSAQMTPEFDVKTTAKMIIGPGSSSNQTSSDGALAILEPGRGASQGISGFTDVKFGEGTQYEVLITPRELGRVRSVISLVQLLDRHQAPPIQLSRLSQPSLHS